MSDRSRFTRATGLISGATMLSRVLGLVRQQLFAALMGASAFAEAFVVAFRIPNLLRDLFAEGALAQAFIPTFKTELKHDGAERAYLLANRVAGLLMLIIGAIVGIAALFAPHIVDSLASTFRESPGQFELTVLLTRIMLPFLLLISLSAVAMGMLNAQERYAAPALAPAMFNATTIAVGLVLWKVGLSGRAVAVGWAIGTLAGGLSQLAVQTPSLWRMGYRPRPRIAGAARDPGVRQIARLMAPALIGLAAVQVNVFINTWFATTEAGAAPWLEYAFRFMQLPIGVFGVAIATVATTRYADAAADSDREAIVDQLMHGLRLVLFLTLPATAGLLVLGRPIIELIYERGRFTAHDSWAVTRALELYIVGLVAYAGVKVIAPAFYAVHRARLPMFASITAVATNVIMNFTLHPHFGYRILALGTAAAATVNFAILYLSFGRAVARIPHRALLAYGARVGFAAAVMAAAVWASHYGLLTVTDSARFPARAMRVFVSVGLGIGAYVGLCKLLRVPELDQFLSRLRRRR